MLLKTFLSGVILGLITLVPVGVKWEIRKRIFVPAAFLIGILSWVVILAVRTVRHLSIYEILAVQVLVIGVTSISLVLWRFFRDPERTPPENANAILAPADGRIIYVKKIEKTSEVMVWMCVSVFQGCMQRSILRWTRK